MVKQRECGNCDVCCVHVSVESVNSPAGQPCQHIKHRSCGSCSIYQNRPSECETYRCSWLNGVLPFSLKPNKSGLLFETSKIWWPRELELHMCFEVVEGMLSEHLETLKKCVPANSVFLLVPKRNPMDTVEMGRQEDVHAYRQWMRECVKRGNMQFRMADGTFDIDLEKLRHDV